MKIKTPMFLAMAFATFAALAEPVEVASNADESQRWFAYPETFVAYSDGYSVLMSRRFYNADGTLNSKENERRFYAGVTNETCNLGFGTLLERQSSNGAWTASAQDVQTASPVTVADIIVKRICDHGRAFREANKQKPKPAPAKKVTAKAAHEA